AVGSTFFRRQNGLSACPVKKMTVVVTVPGPVAGLGLGPDWAQIAWIVRVRGPSRRRRGDDVSPALCNVARRLISNRVIAHDRIELDAVDTRERQLRPRFHL